MVLKRNNFVRSHQDQGSVLVEVLLSVVIISICLTVIIQSMGAGLRASQRAGDYVLGAVFWENYLMASMRDGYTDQSSLQGTGLLEGFGLDAKEEDLWADEEAKQSKVNLDFKKLDVRIHWGQFEHPHQYTAETYLVEKSEAGKN
ncbi:MAG: hypothetical protein HQL26_09430 [Candidatus Omnitrophica bacterium]|nr:hypothetical protein [Candidatus Omnitrophota bacterium]